MKSHASLKALILSLLLLPALAIAADHDMFEMSVALQDAVLLDVDTGSGSIDVRAGSGSEARIIGKIKVNRGFFLRKPANADELIQQVKDNPPVELSDGRLRVGYFEDRSLGKKVSVSYEIVVPADTEVKADTGSGSITVIDIAAPVTADTGSGSIELQNIGGSVKADTGSGSIHADGVAGAFHADTGSGSVFLSQTGPGEVHVDTGSGSTELRGVAGALHVDTGSGRIVVEGRQEGSDWVLDAGSGSIRVALPDDAAFSLNAETNSGSINVDHPVEVMGKISKKHVRGEVRGGGPLLAIDTGSGSIRVE